MRSRLPIAAPLLLVVALCVLAATPSPSSAQSGSVAPDDAALHAELARMDSLFFDALFARCDAEDANAMLTDDAEFYDDRTGLTRGDEVRDGFRRIAGNCPAGNGVRRVVLPGTVEAYPIRGFGAMQTGVHHFVERGAATSTIARFVHLWSRVGGDWKLARIVSVDHRSVDADRAAEMRDAASREADGER